MVDERGNETEAEAREGDAKIEEGVRDLEKGEVGFGESVIHRHSNDAVDHNGTAAGDAHHNNGHEEFQLPMLQRLNPTNPLRIVLNSNTRVAAPSPGPSAQSQRSHPHPPPPPRPIPTPSPTPAPQPQQQVRSFVFFGFCYMCKETVGSGQIIHENLHVFVKAVLLFLNFGICLLLTLIYSLIDSLPLFSGNRW